MVFKLVRTDSVDPCKIPLSTGKHILGRGRFHDCEDKRVSRNHGELEVADDTVVIRALHQNPCFFIKNGVEDVHILKQNCTASLSNGDKFGLLPNSYWYELLYCAMETQNKSPEAPNDQAEQVENEEESVKDDETSNKVNVTDNNDDIKNDEDYEDAGVLSINEINEDNENCERAESPSLLPPENVQSSTEEYKVDDQSATVTSSVDREESRSPAKRPHSPEDQGSGDEVKKVKTEPDDGENKSDDVKPGPSNNETSGASNADDKAKDSPPSPDKPKLLRERCMYGANCYRRNPQHKSQFSHPGDPDWGGGERGVCPWGGGCRKRDPRHWRDHDHPPGTIPPRDPPQPGKRRVRRKRNASSDLSPTLANVVTGKRIRKTIKRLSWSGSDSENEYDMDDPFLTDDSDEWEPPSDFTESQDYSQDQ